MGYDQAAFNIVFFLNVQRLLGLTSAELSAGTVTADLDSLQAWTLLSPQGLEAFVYALRRMELEYQQEGDRSLGCAHFLLLFTSREQYLRRFCSQNMIASTDLISHSRSIILIVHHAVFSSLA